MKENPISNLMRKNDALLVVFATLAAFCTYACMYAFRKPYTAIGYEGMADMMVFGVSLSYKSVLVIAQTIGYTASKFIGIKVVSEMGKSGRAKAIVGLISIAAGALLLFAILPANTKWIALFLNGLPLGMVWGLVFSFLEGRRFTEAMGAGLCVSFIFASGFVKSVGKTLMLDYGVSEFWMPLATGSVFFIPMLIFVYLLSQTPEPTAEDEALRTKREPMNREQRKDFFRKFAPGLIMLIAAYILITAFRDFRDNFMSNVLKALGYGNKPELFTTTEIPVTLGVLGLLAFVMFIKNNRTALLVNHIAIFLGLLTAGISTYAYQFMGLDPVVWLVMTGFATYVAYIPYNALLFERLIASFKYTANAGFLIYLADSFGYLGSVSALLYKDFAQKELSWLDFFIASNYALTGVGCVLALGSLIYFWKKKA